MSPSSLVVWTEQHCVRCGHYLFESTATEGTVERVCASNECRKRYEERLPDRFELGDPPPQSVYRPYRCPKCLTVQFQTNARSGAVRCNCLNRRCNRRCYFVLALASVTDRTP